ncbi:MAG: hypothetical protein ACREPI_03805, partial [Candidatus Dormibacterales bacterium]
MPALRRAAAGLGLLALAFVAFSAAVASRDLAGADHAAAAAFAHLWRPALLPLFDGVAFLGGVELTTLVALATA